mmetsp:Transcript_6992/g.10023  ORF Transcript_6992/g.10023 Transcript_6992/m.10023 type:complete len:258 (-) Transcript_6992:246-1019(-)
MKSTGSMRGLSFPSRIKEIVAAVGHSVLSVLLRERTFCQLKHVFNIYIYIYYIYSVLSHIVPYFPLSPFRNTGDLVSLSENELIDCDPLDLGCSGGLMDNAFLFDENSTGICSEQDYPYVGHKRWFRGCMIKKGLCQPVPGTQVDTFIDVPNTVQDLKQAIVNQPVSVAIEADKMSFQFYKTGVYDDAGCGNQLDHGVLAVGYGTLDDKGYFLVRNSWGPTWGDDGYIKMATQSTTVNGTCGILSFASRPILQKVES